MDRLVDWCPGLRKDPRDTERFVAVVLAPLFRNAVCYNKGISNTITEFFRYLRAKNGVENIVESYALEELQFAFGTIPIMSKVLPRRAKYTIAEVRISK